jgi:DNA helicase-2/ATP-dependent DNA helicase PcrA
MKRRDLPAERFRGSTIDGFALRYANSFPLLSNWNNSQPTGDEQWRDLRPAAARAFEHAAVRKVLSSSYTGAYVDEYQDCTTGQHELVRVVAGILPTRVLGDPMQSVFWKVNAEDQVGWPTVESHFDKIAELHDSSSVDTSE